MQSAAFPRALIENISVIVGDRHWVVVVVTVKMELEVKCGNRLPYLSLMYSDMTYTDFYQ